MHSFWHRVNTILTFFGTVCVALCFLTTATDVIHQARPVVSATISEVKRLVPYLGKDQAVITFDLDADLRSAFSWNTKQLFVYLQVEYQSPENKVNHIVLWDSIITEKDKAVIRLRGHKTKYAFIDQKKNLRGVPLNMSVVWNVMPRVGYLYTRSQTFNVGALPEQYRSS